MKPAIKPPRSKVYASRVSLNAAKVPLEWLSWVSLKTSFGIRQEGWNLEEIAEVFRQLETMVKRL